MKRYSERLCDSVQTTPRFYCSLIGRRDIMGKYFIGWLLGVPVIVLLIIYFIF